MKSAVVIRHVHFEDLGSFAPVLERHGYQVRYLDPSLGELPAATAEEADLLIVLGGPIGVYEDDLYPFLRDELALIGQRLADAQPLLGVCLGAQLIARALGARVYPGPAKEIGWAPLTLTEAGRDGVLGPLDDLPVLHWHGDTFDLPIGAVRLASTQICANQAFAVGNEVLAFQFHPEAAEAGFERWLVGHACEIAAAAGVTVAGLRAQTRDLAATAAGAGQACLEAWLADLEPVAAATTPEAARA